MVFILQGSGLGVDLWVLRRTERSSGRHRGDQHGEDRNPLYDLRPLFKGFGETEFREGGIRTCFSRLVLNRPRTYAVAMVFFAKHAVGGRRSQVGEGAPGQGKGGERAGLRFEHDIDAGEMVVYVEIPVKTAHHKPRFLRFIDRVW